MTAPELPNAPEANAVGAPVEQPVRPRAWAIFVDNGNARMWSTLQPHVQKLADAEGLTITPLYDQAALDAAVAAVRDRMRDLCAIDMASATLKASELAQAAERERCAKKAAPEHIPFSDDEWRVRCEVRDSILEA